MKLNPGFFKFTANPVLSGQKGAILLYMIVVILVAGILGVGIVSLTTTSTFSALTYNASDKARYLAKSGIDYAKNRLYSGDQEFINGEVDGAVFYLEEDGSVELTVEMPDPAEFPNRYSIASTGQVNTGSFMEAKFELVEEFDLIAGEMDIVFSEHNIDTAYGAGVIKKGDISEGYTYENGDLVLYDDRENQLVTVRSNNGLLYSTDFHSLGTEYGGEAGDRDAWIATGHSIDFFPEGVSYTELTIDFRNFSQGDTAAIHLFFDDDPVGTTHYLTPDDIEDSSASIMSIAPFDSFTVIADLGEFGITGFSLE